MCSTFNNNYYTTLISAWFAKYRVLKPCAIPTVTMEAKPASTVARNNRLVQRENKKLVAELLLDPTVAPQENEVHDTADAADTVEPATFTCASDEILIEKIKELETLM